jgi:uncharacterized membrane protein YhaH (DUF805 family)
VKTIKSLFSFKGEVSRGRLWLIWLVIGIVGFPVQLALIAMSRAVGDPQVLQDGGFVWPVSFGGWLIFAVYWTIEFMAVWILAATFVKRWRDVGMSLKWPVITIALTAVVCFALSRLVHEGDVHLSPLAWMVFIMGGFPAGALCFWVFGSIFLAPSHKPHQFDPSKLSDGWKT